MAAPKAKLGQQGNGSKAALEWRIALRHSVAVLICQLIGGIE
jgi:hypothetical protein